MFGKAARLAFGKNETAVGYNVELPRFSWKNLNLSESALFNGSRETRSLGFVVSGVAVADHDRHAVTLAHGGTGNTRRRARSA